MDPIQGIFEEQTFKEKVRRFVVGINNGDPGAVEMVCEGLASADYVGHRLDSAEPLRGAQGLTQYMLWFLEHNPGYHVEMEDFIVLKDKAAARYPQRTDPASGKAQYTLVMIIWHFQGMRCQEDWLLSGPWQDTPPAGAQIV